MQKQIAIIGAGYAGLHLGLYLQSQDVAVTLFSNKTADEIENSQLLNTVARQPHSLERERQLGVNFWDDVALNLHAAKFYLAGEMPLIFDAYVSNTASFLDTRHYTATLLREFEARGGQVVIKNLEKSDLAELSEQFSLVVVASGGKALNDVFVRRAEHSPYEQPQRFLCAGYFKGIDRGDGKFNFVITEHGEILQGVSHSADGEVTHMLIEGIPGQDFQQIADNKYQNDPAAFKQAMLNVIQKHAPTIYERIDPAKFEPRSPLDVIQGAVVPTVRQAYARLDNGKYIVAVGDAHVTNDPIVGQGANTGIESAWILGEMLVNNNLYGEAFCQDAEQAMWNYAQYSTMWANAMLQPPPPYMIDLFINMAQNPVLATAFVDNFDAPEKQWTIISDPANVQAFIAQYSAELVPA